MKVLLIMQSPVNKQNFISVMPPLGILYIASFLESKGIKTDIIDYNVTHADISAVKDYDLVGFSVNCANVTNTLNMAKMVKEKYSKKIIVGGPQVTSDPEFFALKGFIDAAVVGEGEHTLYEYLKCEGPVKGLYLKNDKGETVFGGARPVMTSLDLLPFPAFDKVDLKKYSVPIRKKRVVSVIMSSRGCPFNCIFCFHSLGYSFKPRSAGNVVDEIEWQVKRFGVEEICILDDNISLDIGRAKEIFDSVAKRGIKVAFQLYNGVRADKVDEELLRLMKRSGVWFMSVSPESGDDDTIRRINKGFSKETSKRIVDLSNRMGFFTYASFMIGFPWETEEHIKRTIDFAMDLGTDVAQFARVIAFPNTRLYEMCGLNYKVENDIGLFYNDPKFNISTLSEARINEMIKYAYRRFYFNPLRALRLLRKLRWADIYSMFRYSLTTESI